MKTIPAKTRIKLLIARMNRLVWKMRAKIIVKWRNMVK